MSRATLLVLVLLVLAGAAAAEDLAPRLRAGLVQVYVASQEYDGREPWRQRPPRQDVGRGVVVADGVVLTPARNVKDARLVEVGVANSARRYPARVKHVDGHIGLALVEITDEDLRARLKPLPFGEPARLDDELDIYQLGGDNLIERHTARVVRAEAHGTALSLRVKTTCTDAGDGQIAIADGTVRGLLVRTVRSRQVGTLLGVETLRHYLDDFDDGTYQGCAAPGIWVQPLLREDLRRYYGLGDDRHGIAVTRVMRGRTGDGVIEAGDVLLAVDGHALDDEGNFVDPVHGRLAASYLFQGRRYAGDTIPVRILRDGAETTVEVTLRNHPAREQVVPPEAPGGRPPFLVAGGLVLLELHGDTGLGRGAAILRRYRERDGWDQPGDRARIVFLDHVLSDAANKGFDDLRQIPVTRVNGRTIGRLADVAAALEQPEGKFHVIELEGVETDIVFPVAELAEIDARIAATYKVTETRHLPG